jgi:hypothetical protein
MAVPKTGIQFNLFYYLCHYYMDLEVYKIVLCYHIDAEHLS